MKARPILMHGRSVRNLLAGRKTQTRRICKDQSAKAYQWVSECPTYPEGSHFTGWAKDCGFPFLLPARPYGQPGDLLWVREKHSLLESSITGLAPPVWYWADGSISEGDYTRPRPSIFMPRWASRLTLRLSDVRVERVHDISEDDAKAEGAEWMHEDHLGQTFGSHRRGFEKLWNDTNGVGAWDRNDWVWVLCFDVIHANVDDVLADA